MRFQSLTALLVLLVGCSDFDCPKGESRVDGMCSPADAASFDPDPITKTIWLGCSNNITVENENGQQFQSLLPWDLTVDPGPIVSGVPFGADFEALARFDQYFLSAVQTGLGGVTRADLIELQATVHVRRGVTKGEDVELMFEPIPTTCRFDSNGREGPLAGPFPSCSNDNDNSDGSNDDCVGLGGAPDPQNRCGQFVPIPISSDCSPGGMCESVDNPWALIECEANGFCGTGPVEVVLRGSLDAYRAAAFGQVLFGWDDVSTGAEVDETSGPNDGTWILPPAIFENDAGPNSMRWFVGDTRVALECTMADSSWGRFGVRSSANLTSPVPDHLLISFPIQEP